MLERHSSSGLQHEAGQLYFSFARGPSEVAEAQRLRYKVFAEEMGANLPGVGRIDTIKRVNGEVIVTTTKGIIASSLEPRRGPYFLPRGY